MSKLSYAHTELANSENSCIYSNVGNHSFRSSDGNNKYSLLADGYISLWVNIAICLQQLQNGQFQRARERERERKWEDSLNASDCCGHNQYFGDFVFSQKVRKLVRVLKNGPKYVISHFRMNSNQLIKRPWMHGIRKPILKLRDVYVCPHCSHAAQLRPTDRTQR